MPKNAVVKIPKALAEGLQAKAWTLDKLKMRRSKVFNIRLDQFAMRLKATTCLLEANFVYSTTVSGNIDPKRIVTPDFLVKVNG